MNWVARLLKAGEAFEDGPVLSGRTRKDRPDLPEEVPEDPDPV